MAGPRRLEWDEPAPADLYEHLDADDGEDALAGLAPTVGTRAPGVGKWHHPVGDEGTACGRRRVMSNWEVASLSDIPVGDVCSPCAKAMR